MPPAVVAFTRLRNDVSGAGLTASVARPLPGTSSLPVLEAPAGEPLCFAPISDSDFVFGESAGVAATGRVVSSTPVMLDCGKRHRETISARAIASAPIVYA